MDDAQKAEDLLFKALGGQAEEPQPEDEQEEAPGAEHETEAAPEDTPEEGEPEDGSDEGEDEGDYLTIKIDDREERLTRDEAIRRLQMAGAAETRFEQAKEERRRAKEEADQLLAQARSHVSQSEQQRTWLEQRLEQAQAWMGEPPRMMTPEEAARDPIGAIHRQHEVAAWQQKAQQIQQAQQEIARQRATEHQETLGRQRNAEIQKFREAVPDFDQSRDLPRITTQIQKLGHDPKILAGMGDGLGALMAMALKAQKYDELTGKNREAGANQRPPTDPGADQRPKIMRPGTAKNVQSQKSRRRDDAAQRLRKTGSESDAVALLTQAMRG